MKPTPPTVAAIARINQWYLKFDPEKPDVEFWNAQLGDIPVPAVVAAVDQRARVCPAFPPEIGEVVATARALMAPPRPTLGDVRLEITTAIRDIGAPPVGCSSTYEFPKFSETTAAVVKRMNGWAEVARKPGDGTLACRDWEFRLSRAYGDDDDQQMGRSQIGDGGDGPPDGLAGDFGLDLRLGGK